MDTEIDWQRELDASFGRGEDLAPTLYAQRGRRALRRRRVAAVAVASLVLVGGGAAWASVPGGGPSSDAPVATQGPSPDGPGRTGDRAAEEERLRSLEELSQARDGIDFLGNPAALTPDGLVAAPPTTAILEEVTDPMEYDASVGTSIAIRATFRGHETYSLMVLYADGSTSTTSARATGDFAGWLASTVDTQRSLDAVNGVTGGTGGTGGTQPENWLRLGPTGRVEATRPGVVLVEERTSVDLGDFALGADRVGAVRLVVDDESRYAVYRTFDGQLEVLSGPGHFASLDAFVDWARRQYESGAGMR